MTRATSVRRRKASVKGMPSGLLRLLPLPKTTTLPPRAFTRARALSRYAAMASSVVSFASSARLPGNSTLKAGVGMPALRASASFAANSSSLSPATPLTDGSR